MTTTFPTALNSPTFNIELSLLPRAEEYDLSFADFAQQPVRLFLSEHFSAQLHLTHEELERLGISAHRAWEMAAARLLSAARTAQGVRFYTRPAAHGGLEVACEHHPISAWLAHPHTFTILDSHLMDILGGEISYQLLPGGGLRAFTGLKGRRLVWDRGYPTFTRLG